MKKHIGVLSNTGTRIVVIFREVPGEADNCLVVELDRLPDLLNNAMLDMLSTRDAEATNDFYEVLNKRQFPDGSPALSELHRRSLLRKVPVEQVLMEPYPGRKLPLKMINDQISGNASEEADTDKAPELAKQQADSLLVQAKMLEQEAEAKRQQAYKLYPGLNPQLSPTANETNAEPKKKGRPELSPEEKAIRLEQQKERRRERDRERAALKKTANEAKALDKAVAEKIARDMAAAQSAD